MPKPSQAAPAALNGTTGQVGLADAVLLQALGVTYSDYHTHTGWRSVTLIRRSDHENLHRLQTPFCPNGHETLGVWYGHERRFDSDGRAWERSVHAVVDNFGELVEVPL